MNAERTPKEFKLDIYLSCGSAVTDFTQERIAEIKQKLLHVDEGLQIPQLYMLEPQQQAGLLREQIAIIISTLEMWQMQRESRN